MIVYTAYKGVYEDYAASLRREPNRRHKIYVNLTNRCNCACTFCLRNTKERHEGHDLWLAEEPTARQVIDELAKYDIAQCEEITMCGFGEPTLALPVLLETLDYIKSVAPQVPTRLNTNGLAQLEYAEPVAPLFKGLLDTVSISLNASTAREYARITRNRFGESAYPAMLDFAVQCGQYVPNVVFTVVSCIGEAEIEACRKVCDNIGVKLRVRQFE